MLVVAIGWDIYERTGSAMALGIVGLVQFLPVMALTLPAGHIVDNYDRRKVMIFAQLGSVLSVLGMLWVSFQHGTVEWMYLFLLVMGMTRAFISPTSSALMPQLVSEENFTHGVTLSSISFQTASVIGPALGGLVIAKTHNAVDVYIVDLVCITLYVLALLFIRQRTSEPAPKKAMTMQSMMAGIHFIKSTPVILAAITLDLFAVLFGGAITLLPIFAKDILHVGPDGLGWLQSAPAFGAILMGLWMARFKEIRNSGPLLFWTVVGFGISTIVFGLSKSFWLSIAMMFLAGAFDNISVIIRIALVQLRTPDEMRGRVSAVNYVFIGASNELGGFESGLMASWLGPVLSVVTGGIATLATVAWVAWKWPELRKLDKLRELPPDPEHETSKTDSVLIT